MTPNTNDQDQPRCGACKNTEQNDGAALMKCSACFKVAYCSKQCQRADWKLHKSACIANRSGACKSKPSSPGNIHSGLDGHQFFNTIACTDPKAQHLATALNITLGGGTALPLRRLVVTGLDTDDNLQLLFGPEWRRSMLSSYEEARLEALLKPPMGSPSYCLNVHMDKGSPTWSPRPASDAEQRKFTEVKAMQEMIQRRVEPGESPTNADMMAILTSFGANWSDKVPIYQLAANTIDQGVPADGMI